MTGQTNSHNLVHHRILQFGQGTDVQGVMKEKPEVVDLYNKNMLGVDKMDQLATYYSFLRKSLKW